MSLQCLCLLVTPPGVRSDRFRMDWYRKTTGGTLLMPLLSPCLSPACRHPMGATPVDSMTAEKLLDAWDV